MCKNSTGRHGVFRDILKELYCLVYLSSPLFIVLCFRLCLVKWQPENLADLLGSRVAPRRVVLDAVTSMLLGRSSSTHYLTVGINLNYAFSFGLFVGVACSRIGICLGIAVAAVSGACEAEWLGVQTRFL